MIEGRAIYKDHIILYITALLFILANSIFIMERQYFLAIFPLILILIGLGFLAVDKLLILTVFLVPFSMEWSYIIGRDTNMDFSFPTEPLLAGIVLLLILKYFQGQPIDRKILRHPVSISIYFYLVWIFITSITSTMPSVSFKFMTAKIWFIVPFFFLASQIFLDRKKVLPYLKAVFIPFLIIIAYVLYRHSQYGFTDQQASHYVVSPFYNDHTSYGAVLAMILPALIGYYIAFVHNKGIFSRLIVLTLIIYFITAIIFSYTRAAWASLFAAFFIWIVIKLRIPWPVILMLSITILLTLFSFRTEIVMTLEKNRQVSSSDFTEHAQSIANISRDESNLERINRWNCALRMFREKPVFGWGPGTYMFQYAPFQVTHEKTSISTNKGTGGNAHSEYLGPLAESGIFGMLGFILILFFSIRTGLRVYFRSANRETSIMALAVCIGLITYYTHGFLNNFLDTDKASVLFWGFTAILVSLDITGKKKGLIVKNIRSKHIES